MSPKPIRLRPTLARQDVQGPKPARRRRSQARDLKNGRIAFRSEEEKAAWDLAHLPAAALRSALASESRIGVLGLALQHLEGHHVILNAKLIQRRIEKLSPKYPETKPYYDVLHESGREVS